MTTSATPSIRTDVYQSFRAVYVKFLDYCCTKISDNAIISWALFLLCLASPFMIIPSSFDYANLPQKVFIQTGSLLITVFWFVFLAIKKCQALRPSPFTLPLFGFLAWASFSSLHAHNSWEGWDILSHWLTCGLIYILVLNVMRHETDCRRLLASIAVAAGAVAVLGLSQHLLGLDLLPQAAPPSATFANKNVAAQFMVLALPVSAALILTSSRPGCWLWMLIFAIILVFIFFTGTRAAWLAVLIQCLVVMVLSIRNKFHFPPLHLSYSKKTILAFGIGTVALLSATIFLLVLPRLEQLMPDPPVVMISVEHDHSAHGGVVQPYDSIGLRLAIWRNTLEMIRDKPMLGFGLGNHKVFYPVYHDKVIVDQAFSEDLQLQNVHNDYLQVAAEMGISGILLAAWLGFAFFRVAFGMLTAPGSPLQFEVQALGVSGAGIMVNAAFCFPLERAIPPFVGAVFLGITAFAYWKGRPEVEKSQPFPVMPRWLVIITGVVFMGLFCTSVVKSFRVLASDGLLPSIVRYEKAGDWSAMAEVSELALILWPGNPRILAYQGKARLKMGDYLRAVESLRAFIAVYPYNMNALLNLGATLYALERFDEAQTAFDRVLEIVPGMAKAHHNIAGVYAQQGRSVDSLEARRRAAKLDPEDALIQFYLGLTEIQYGNPSLAAEAFIRTVAIRPDWELARKNLGILYALYLNEPHKAIYELQKSLDVNPYMKDADRVKELIDKLIHENTE